MEAHYCDGAVLVISQGEVSSRVILDAKNQLVSSGVRILGAVLNKVRMEGSRYGHYYGRYYGSYYGKYYGHYGKSVSSGSEERAISSAASETAAQITKKGTNRKKGSGKSEASL